MSLSKNNDLLLEHIMRDIFGEKAYNIASSLNTFTELRAWIRKAIKNFIQIINKSETLSLSYKESLLARLNHVYSAIDRYTSSEDLIAYLLSIITTLIGYGVYNSKGMKLFTIWVTQTPQQYYSDLLVKGKDVMQQYYDEKNFLAKRREIIASLQQGGYKTFEIAQILNTTEYEVLQTNKLTRKEK